MKIEPQWPRYDNSGRPAPELSSLVGATILRIGTPVELGLDGGGLAIEVQHGGGEIETLIVAFSDVGMWKIEAEPSRSLNH